MINWNDFTLKRQTHTHHTPTKTHTHLTETHITHTHTHKKSQTHTPTHTTHIHHTHTHIHTTYTHTHNHTHTPTKPRTHTHTHTPTHTYTHTHTHKSLKNAECPRNLYYLSQGYFSQQPAALTTNHISIERRVTKRCPQGSCCGPGFWNLLYNSLFKLEFTSHTKVIAFADDLIILTTGK